MILGVLSVVHHADDVRIREKLIRTLSVEHDIEYHTRLPAPADLSDVVWHPINGSRFMRNLRLAGLLWRRDFDAVVLVDPETFLAGILASRRLPVIFDIHENLPAQILNKRIPLRRLVSAVSRRVLRLAERNGHVTLAEPGYAELFSDDHPVFENYPVWDRMPTGRESDGSVVYVGDVTIDRGATDLVRAAAMAGLPITMVGRCSPDFADALMVLASELGADLRLSGRLPWKEAMDRLASAAVAASPLRDIPNYRHSLPTKVLEYVGLGVPVVATDLPGTAAVLAGVNGTSLVPPGDIDAMARALQLMATDESRQAARSAAIQVRSAFAWPADAVRDYYAGVVGRPGRSPDR